MKNVGKVLAEGEVTGHSHRLQNTDVLEREDGVRIFDVAEKETVVHEEHGAVVLPAEQYACDRVIEQDHFADAARKVTD